MVTPLHNNKLVVIVTPVAIKKRRRATFRSSFIVCIHYLPCQSKTPIEVCFMMEAITYDGCPNLNCTPSIEDSVT